MELTPTTVAVVNPATEPLVIKSTPVHGEARKTSNVVVGATTKPAVDAGYPELASLRWQIAALQLQLQQLSEVVSQQKAAMAEPGRFKFLPLTSSAAGMENSTVAPLSDGIQRAISYAMAREMGGLPGFVAGAVPASTTAAGAKVFAGVEFVDLKAAPEPVPTVASVDPQTKETADNNATEPVINSSGKIPGLMTATNFMAFLDRSIVPQGGPLTFWNASDHGQQLVGSAVLSDNPMVVTIPMGQLGNGAFTVTATGPAGGSVVVGYFNVVRNPQPVTPGNSSP